MPCGACFQVEAPLARPDLPDALEQLVEVVLAEHCLALLQAFVIEHEALDDELAQGLGRPDAKLSRLVAVDAVANGDDRVEVVELDLPSDLPAAFRLNYFHFGNSCRPAELLGLENVGQVLVDGRHIDAEQLGHMKPILRWCSERTLLTTLCQSATSPAFS